MHVHDNYAKKMCRCMYVPIYIDNNYVFWFQSETAVLMIPELNLECEQRSLGGRFTTIEGLLTEVRDQLQKFNPFSGGDSDTKTNFKDFIKKLSEVCLYILGIKMR